MGVSGGRQMYESGVEERGQVGGITFEGISPRMFKSHGLTRNPGQLSVRARLWAESWSRQHSDTGRKEKPLVQCIEKELAWT